MSFLRKFFGNDLIFPGLRTYFILVFFLRIFFLQDFFSCDLFLNLGSSHIILGKISQKLKLRTLFLVTFCPRTSENWDFLIKVFIYRFFMCRNFFRSVSIFVHLYLLCTICTIFTICTICTISTIQSVQFVQSV